VLAVGADASTSHVKVGLIEFPNSSCADTGSGGTSLSAQDALGNWQQLSGEWVVKPGIASLMIYGQVYPAGAHAKFDMFYVTPKPGAF
jgi:hypothetical protein